MPQEALGVLGDAREDAQEALGVPQSRHKPTISYKKFLDGKPKKIRARLDRLCKAFATF